MPSYLILGNWTDQGIRDIKESPDRLEAAKKAAEAAGGSIVYFYMTMGQYDLAVLTELPDDDAAARFILAIGRQGSVRSTTLRAFTEDEYRSIVSSLP